LDLGRVTLGSVPIETLAEPKKDERRVWQVVLSPEEILSLPLETFCLLWIREMAHRAVPIVAPSSIEWAGALHTNTESPHFHLFIRGITKDGVELKWPEEAIVNSWKVATEIQQQLLGGEGVEGRILIERKAAVRIGPLPRIDGLTLDDLAWRAQDRTWAEALLLTEKSRRKALHGRLTLLERLGLIAVSQGRISVPLDLAASVKIEQQIVDTIRTAAKPGLLSKDAPIERVTRRTPSTIGCLDQLVRIDIGGHGMDVALVETVTNKVLALAIDKTEHNNLVAWTRARRVVRIRRGRIELLSGDVKTILNRGLRPSGPVTKYLLARNDLETIARTIGHDLVASAVTKAADVARVVKKERLERPSQEIQLGD
jgi:hypothetical protein